jgi:hypothetical protein
MNAFKKMLLITTFAATFGAATGAHASLIGNTVTATGFTLGPTTAVVNSGIEFSGIVDYIKFDFGASTLTLTSPTTSVGWGDFGKYVFSGFTDVITGLTVASNTGFSGAMLTGFSFGTHSVTMDMGSGSAQQNAKLVFNIATATVPEPTTVALLGLGLLGVAASRRKSVKSKNA